jgi:hypothetical protein
MRRSFIAQWISTDEKLYLIPINIVRGVPQVLNPKGSPILLHLGHYYIMQTDFCITPVVDYLVVGRKLHYSEQVKGQGGLPTQTMVR